MKLSNNNTNNLNLKLRLEDQGLKEIKPITKKIIHRNIIYFGKLKNGKEVVVKLFKNLKSMKNEIFCNKYLRANGLLVPYIINYCYSRTPYIIMDKIKGTEPSAEDIQSRIIDLAKVHVVSLNDTNLSRNIPVLTKEKRIKNLMKNIKTLKSNSFIPNSIYAKFDVLIKHIKNEKTQWGRCFCFNDFFINNSFIFMKKTYYFDFEKSMVSFPFIDVGCIVINYPKKYDKIKSFYTRKIIAHFKASKIKNIEGYISRLNFLIDIGICEKVIDDAAFLSNDSIRKSKSNIFCKKLALKRLKSVSFVFNNLGKDSNTKC